MSAQQSLWEASGGTGDIEAGTGESARSPEANSRSPLREQRTSLLGNAAAMWQSGGQSDLAATVSYHEFFSSYLETFVASNKKAKFIILIWATLACLFILSACWVAVPAPEVAGGGGSSKKSGGASAAVASGTDVYDPYSQYAGAMYIVMQLLATGGFDSLKRPVGQECVLVAAILCGVLVFAVLVGFVNDAVAETMANLNRGRTKVATSGFTLILGWNEATVRVVCQIAFLRRALIKQNETLLRRIFPFLRVKGSTPLASNPVVVMCDSMTKDQMDTVLKEALLERGIKPSRTRVGWHIICRVGNPTDTHDLLRIGAHRATSILVMMTEEDGAEKERSHGVITGGATLRTLLAVRRVLLDPLYALG